MGGHSENKESAAETRKFFLNCLCLLLGRFDRNKFESVVSEYGIRISHVILPQVVVVYIMKVACFSFIFCTRKAKSF